MLFGKNVLSDQCVDGRPDLAVCGLLTVSADDFSYHSLLIEDEKHRDTFNPVGLRHLLLG